MKMKAKQNFGNFTIEYRKERDGFLHFLRKTIMDTEEALKESNKLKDLGYHDILIKKIEK